MAHRTVLNQPPASVDALRQAAQQHYAALSPRLQQVADLLLRDPQAIATDSSRALAQALGLPPATLTRFAKAMGYATFKEIQALCRQQYVNQPRDYLERIKRAEGRGLAAPEPAALYLDLAHAVQQSLQTTAVEVSASKLREAAGLLRGARDVWVHGVRRAYPVALYLQYLLLKVGVAASQLDSSGGLLEPNLARMHPQGVLLVVSYSPHAAETEQVLEKALQLQVPTIALSDPVPSRHAKHMRVLFVIREGEVMGFRALASSMYVAQALALQIAQDRVAGAKPRTVRPPKPRRNTS